MMQGNYALLRLIGYNLTDMREYFRLKHVNMIKERVEENIFKCTIKCKDFAISPEDEPIDLYKRMAEVRR